MPADQEQRPGARTALDEQEYGLDEQEHGALDMLLTSHYEPVPPDGYFDTFLASVEERIEGEGLDGNSKEQAAGGGQAPDQQPRQPAKAEAGDAGAIFKSSPALEALRIPEPRRTSRTTGSLSAVSAAELPAMAPPQPSGAYRWPVAFVLAAAIGVGGFLVYKKTAEPPLTTRPMPPTLSAAGPRPGVAATPIVTGADATVVAAATRSVDGGATQRSDDPGAGSDPSKDPKPARVAGGKRRRHKATKLAKADPEQPRAAKPGKRPRVKATAPVASKKGAPKKGGDALDSLLDTALGKSGQAAAAKPKKAEPVKADAPASLTMNQIGAAMKRIGSRVGACYDKYQVEGTARVKLTITRDGKPKDISIKGKFFGTDTGACVRTAVKAARFPTFSGKEPTITYPFRLAE